MSSSTIFSVSISTVICTAFWKLIIASPTDVASVLEVSKLFVTISSIFSTTVIALVATLASTPVLIALVTVSLIFADSIITLLTPADISVGVAVAVTAKLIIASVKLALASTDDLFSDARH